MSDETDPLLLLLRSFLGQATAYFALVGLTFLAIWRLGERRFRGRRIQERKRVDGKQLRHEVKYTLVTLAIGTLNAVAITLLYQAGLTALSNDPTEWSWPTLALGFVGLIVLNDAWFYWWHRFRHTSDFLWRGFHQIHHSPQRLEVITSFYKHPLEMVVNSILGSLIVYTLLGLTPAAGAVYTACCALGEFFYHTNVRTPRSHRITS